MRLTESLGLDRPGGISKPSASWRVPQAAEERLQPAIETRWYRMVAWVLVVIGFGYVLTFARHFPDPDNSFFLSLKAYFLILIGEGALFYLYRRVSDGIYFGPGLRRIQTKLPVEQSCPVRVTIRQDHVVTGADEGFMWIEEGTLYFKGLQTVFRLNRDDLPQVTQWPRSIRPNMGTGKMPTILPVFLEYGTARIQVELIDPFEDFASRRRAHSFHISLYDWLLERPQGEIETLLPPGEVHPALLLATRAKREALIGSFLLVALNLAVFLTSSVDSGLRTLASFTSLLTLMANLTLIVQSVRLAWQMKHDLFIRGRIAREVAAARIF